MFLGSIEKLDYVVGYSNSELELISTFMFERKE